MEREKKEYKISNYFEQTDEHFTYEIAFKRWLVFELETKKMTIKEASENFNITLSVLYHWRDKYSSEMVLPLPDMTAEDICLEGWILDRDVIKMSEGGLREELRRRRETA